MTLQDLWISAPFVIFAAVFFFAVGITVGIAIVSKVRRRPTFEDSFKTLKEDARLGFIESRIHLQGKAIETLYGFRIPEEHKGRYILDLEMDPDLPAQHVFDVVEGQRIHSIELYRRIFPEDAAKKNHGGES